MKNSIVFKDVSFAYPDSEKIISNLNMKVGVGEFVIVVGSSGSGKTTFLRMINGLIPHFTGGTFSGSVTVFGKDTKHTTTREMSREVGLVFQDPESQFVMSSVESELAFGMENLALPNQEIRYGMELNSKRFKLEKLMKRQVETLSGGEKQKTILASVLAMTPSILLFDEPTSQLDPESTQEFIQNLNRLKKEGATIILSEHRIERLLHLADKLFDMDNMAFGKPADVMQSMKNRPSYTELSIALDKRGYDIRTPTNYSSAKKAFRNLRYKKIPKDKPLNSGEKIIEVIGLSKSFKNVPVLSGINLGICRGDFLAVIGANGCGKTTLVKHFNGLLKPDSGSVHVLGEDIASFETEEIAKTVGYVSQNPNEYLFSDTVYDELMFTLDNLGVTADPLKTLEFLGIAHLKDRYPRDLSGGERQLCALASVIVSGPEVVVFDEPTRGVDIAWKKNMMGVLERIWKKGKTIVLVTHDIDSIAAHCKRACIMAGGSIVADGCVREVLYSNKKYQPTIMSVLG
ncbi:MAG: energy-coupling factor ABC transporter ATP-binding protein, partial [Candidatus Altiarchaeota archaeon]|nr:energy-coupling factor ABC transporter ATP-binding protein [Candidatus Altiarchaeota archaeon]